MPILPVESVGSPAAGLSPFEAGFTPLFRFCCELVALEPLVVLVFGCVVAARLGGAFKQPQIVAERSRNPAPCRIRPAPARWKHVAIDGPLPREKYPVRARRLAPLPEKPPSKPRDVSEGGETCQGQEKKAVVDQIWNHVVACAALAE